MCLSSASLGEVEAPSSETAQLSKFVSYRKWKIGLNDGYTEHKKLHNLWIVHAKVNTPFTFSNPAVLVNLYRSAVITKAAGYSHFFTSKFSITNWEMNGYPRHQEIDTTITLHNAGDALPRCQESEKRASNCRDYSADEVIAVIGPVIGQDPNALQHEIQATKSRYYSAQ